MSGAAAPAPSRATLVGYVEALNAQEALGWVWCPGHSDRLRVDLLLGDIVVAQGVADQNRDDLARSGIGDGRHAFALPVPPDASSRATELRVLAHPLDGPAVLLGPPPAAPAVPDTLVALQRGVETLVSSQRLLHRNLQSALLQQGPSPASALAEIASAQGKLTETIKTVELFVVRLETALQNREPASPATAPRRMLAASVVISCLAFMGSCWAVYHVVFGS